MNESRVKTANAAIKEDFSFSKIVERCKKTSLKS